MQGKKEINMERKVYWRETCDTFCTMERERNTVLFKGETVRNMPGIPPLGFSFDGINL
jgi:hypothetical protein